MKIAIIGCSESHDLAPWDDSTWIKWGLRQDNRYWAWFDLMFEIHDKDMLVSLGKWDKAKERISLTKAITREDYGLNSEIYPLLDIFSQFGEYLTSSVAYMLALAIHKNASHIGIWGVEMNEDQYFHQRPNFEYLIGFAKGKGIKVTIPDACPLLKAPLYGI